jgi:hypothetical protein
MTTVRVHGRSETWVEGHYRNGHWVQRHYRSGTTVAEHDRSVYGHHPASSVSGLLRAYTTTLTYPTKCWWCSAAVFFHRSDNGGCALFDELGWPWPLHDCWQRYRDWLLHRVSAELDDLHFNGRSYTQPRKQMKKERGQTTFCGIGFVDKADAQHQENQLQLRSCRGSSTVTLVPVRFVPDDRPGEYLLLYAPRDYKEVFAPYSIHQIDASWIKRGNHWLCLVTSTRILQAHSRPAGRARSILQLHRRCYYCDTELGDTDVWGLDTAGNEECGDCGRMRFHLPSNTFLQRIQRISQSFSARSKKGI